MALSEDSGESHSAQVSSEDYDRNRGAHGAVFVCCGALLLMAVLLALIGDVDGVLKIGGLPIPSTCIFKNATGLPCAGCGLTRSWVSLAGGDLESSLYYHRFGWLVMLYVALQTLRHGLWLVWKVMRRSLEKSGWWLDRAIFLIIVILFVNWFFVLFD